MARWKVGVVCAGLALATALLAGAAFSQEQQGGGGRPGGGAGGGGWDPAQMQERALDSLRAQLTVTDDQWAAMKPVVLKVSSLSEQVQRPSIMRLLFAGRRPGGMGAMMGGTEAAEVEKTEMQIAQEALEAAVHDAAATDEQLAATMQAMSDARAKIEKQLAEEQQKLRDMADAHTKGQLMLLGLL